MQLEAGDDRAEAFSSAAAGRSTAFRRLTQLLAAAWLAFATVATAQDTKNVLVIYGNNARATWFNNFEASLRSTVTGATRQRVEFYTEFFDLEQFSADKQASAFINLLHERYADRKIGVVVAGGNSAFAFLESRRKDLFPELPLVYSYLPADRVEAPPPSTGIVGPLVDLNPLPTVEFALRLHPRTKRLVLVTGGGAWDIAWEKRLRRATSMASKSVNASTTVSRR